jgi:peroxiredoxin
MKVKRNIFSFVVCLILSLGIAAGMRFVYPFYLDIKAERTPQYQQFIDNKQLTWNGPELGEKVNLSKLKDINGEFFINNLKNEKALIVSIHPDCGMCHTATDHIQKVLDEASINSYDVALVSFDPTVSIERIINYKETVGLPYRSYAYRGSESEILPSLSKMVTPSFILVNPDGIILKKYPGSSADARIRRAMIKEILSDVKK